ncbi:MAG: hypothetical protein OEM67_06065 [Thermoleophilia bacterium]|nr:hypothetical protein [Thermoleophilia bacterium]
MTKTRRLSVFMAVGAVGLGAALAAPAVAHEQKHGDKSDAKEISKGDKGSRAAARAERRAYRVELRRTKRDARHALRTCEIHPDKLIQVKDSKLLTLLKSRFDAKVGEESGDWTATKAEMKLARVKKRITIRAAMKSARWRPMLVLFDADSKKDLGMMLRKAGRMRSLMEDKGVTRAALLEAKRAGKLARYQAVIELCTSGKDPVDQEPEPEESTEPVAAPVPASA